MSIKHSSKYALTSRPVNVLRIGTVAAMAFVSTAAYAQEFSAPEKIEVSVKVAQLQTPEGAAKVYESLSAKALEACTPQISRIPDSMIRECAADLLDQFVDNLNKTEVTQLHTQQDA